jgi:hypothetical protein
MPSEESLSVTNNLYPQSCLGASFAVGCRGEAGSRSGFHVHLSAPMVEADLFVNSNPYATVPTFTPTRAHCSHGCHSSPWKGSRDGVAQRDHRRSLASTAAVQAGRGYDASHQIILFPAAVFVAASQWRCMAALHPPRLVRWRELEPAVREAIDS